MEQDVLTQSLSSNDCHCLSNILHTFFKPHSGSSLDSHYIQSPVPGPLNYNVAVGEPGQGWGCPSQALHLAPVFPSLSQAPTQMGPLPLSSQGPIAQSRGFILPKLSIRSGRVTAPLGLLHVRPCAFERAGTLPLGVGGWGVGGGMGPTMGRRVPGWREPVCKEFHGGFSSPTASVPLPLPVPPLEDSAVPVLGVSPRA